MRPAVVFLGPTLAHDEARTVLDAEFLPPAAHGDVLRAAFRRPQAIGIVDGVFEHVPAVWHKEILFALSEGIHVYGAASMGALRAAELDRFGMRGIGEVYRAYADGVLEDDDEVAVAHAGAEDGFQAMSDPMVDIRATLNAAVSNGIASEQTAATIVAQIKATFYPRRLLLGALNSHDDDHLRLREWLPDGWVRRKRDDALALLANHDRRSVGRPRAVPPGLDAATHPLLGGRPALGGTSRRAPTRFHAGSDRRRGARVRTRRSSPRSRPIRPTARSVAPHRTGTPWRCGGWSRRLVLGTSGGL